MSVKSLDRRIIEFIDDCDMEEKGAALCKLCGRPFTIPDDHDIEYEWQRLFCLEECSIEYEKIKRLYGK